MYEQLPLYPSETEYKVYDKAVPGQFFTPPGIAEFMCGLFSTSRKPEHLLDPGAGQGMLTKTFLEKYPDLQNATLIERDLGLIPMLRILFTDWYLKVRLINEDFIKLGTGWVTGGKCPFSHVIMNPPYKKIGS